MYSSEDLVFISYVRNDSLLAEELAQILKNENINVWLAKNEIEIGDNKQEVTNSALEKATYIILLISKYAFNSSWVRTEWEHAVLNERFKNRILPVIIGRIDSEEFKNVPWFIKKTEFLQIQEGNLSEDAKIIATSFNHMIKS